MLQCSTSIVGDGEGVGLTVGEGEGVALAVGEGVAVGEAVGDGVGVGDGSSDPADGFWASVSDPSKIEIPEAPAQAIKHNTANAKVAK